MSGTTLYYNSDKKDLSKLVTGSVWVCDYTWGDVKGICETPMEEKGIYYHVIEDDRLRIRYKISYKGNNNPDKVFTTYKHVFIKEYSLFKKAPKKMSDYKADDKVFIRIVNIKSGKKEWVDGVVVSNSSLSKVSNYIIVKYTRTYYKSIRSNDLLGDEGYFYDKETTSGIYHSNEIKERA